MEITVLCKVVDNFGDIGVVWRMCRRFLEIDKALCVNLITDNLDAFSKICDSVDSSCDIQKFFGVNVWNWNAEKICEEEFYKNDGEKLSLILECFQCGRPEWMEEILFEKKLERTVHILMIDYLTAEKYAEDFHCLMSLTRSAKVQKVNFMPGFTEKTGGLIIEDEWAAVPAFNPKGDILVFTYENNLLPLSIALKKCSMSEKKVLLAQGRGRNAFVEAWTKVNNLSLNRDCCADKLLELPYLNQTDWDELMKKCSVLVIRGEESLSRACLSGIPFIWNAYPQSDEYQLIKVEALLARMERHFIAEDFSIVKKAWILFNTPLSDSKDNSEQALESAFCDFFKASYRLAPSFYDFALSLRKNGDLCSNIMTFIKKKCIIQK